MPHDSSRPALIFDGDCSFCRLWVDFWRTLTGDRVDYRTYQEVGANYPAIPPDDFQRAVQFIAPDGHHARAAEASFLQSGPDNGSLDAFELELRALRHDFSELANSWTSYLERWTPPAITESRAAFGQETTDMMTAFKLRIARENSITYPLALEAGRIALHET